MSLGISSVLVNSVEYISAAKFDGFQIDYSSGSRIGVATLNIDSTPASFVILPNHDVKIYDSSSVLLFRGTVAKIEPSPVTGGSATTRYKLTVRDYAALLDQAIIPGPLSYSGLSDQAIIQALLSAYAPSIGQSGIASTTTIDIITFENISVRQALEKIVQLTGCQFFVDANLDLQYHSPSGSAAPFSISETPNFSSTFPTLVKALVPVTDFQNGANYVSVIGAIGTGGTPYSAIVQDAGSQGTYGVLKRTIIDRSLKSNAACTARGNVELASYKNPQISGTLVVRQSGLKLGQLLTISLPSVNVSGSYLIQRITAKWDSDVDVRYEVQYGAYIPDMARWLRALTTDPPNPPGTPVATIPPGSITANMLAPLSVAAAQFAASIQPVILVNGLPTLPSAVTTLKIICDGDSLTVGYPVDPAGSYPTKLASLLGSYADVHNLGENGAQTTTLIASHIAAADALYDASKTANLYLLQIGSNDGGVGRSAAATYANITTIVSGRKATGFKVIVNTIPPAAFAGWGGGWAAFRTALNALILGNTAAADYVVDSGSNSAISNVNDTTKYQPDLLHMAAAGYAVIAQDDAQKISSTTSPSPGYPVGSVVLNLGDGKLYRNIANHWSAAVPTTDLSGQIAAGQIAANAVTAGTIAANAVTAGTIAAGVIVGTMISATASITQSNIGGSGVVTDISQIFDASLSGGFYTGIQVRTTSGASPRASVGPLAYGLVNSSNQVAALLSAAVGSGRLQLYTGGTNTILITSSPAAMTAFGSGTQQAGLQGSGHFGTAGSVYIENSSSVVATAMEADGSGFGAVCFDNYATFAMRCDTNRTRFKFIVTALSAGTVTVSAATLGFASSITSAMWGLISGVPGEKLGGAYSGSSVIVTSDNGASTSSVIIWAFGI